MKTTTASSLYSLPIALRESIVVSYIPISQWEEVLPIFFSKSYDIKALRLAANVRLSDLLTQIQSLLTKFLTLHHEISITNEKEDSEDSPTASQSGTVKSVSLSNVTYFDKHWECSLHPELNLLVGREKKSCMVLKAIAACLSPHTGCNTSFLSELVDERTTKAPPHHHHATIEICISNAGPDAYRPSSYGPDITIQCRIFRNGSRHRVIKGFRDLAENNYSSNVVQDTCTLELQRILQFFNRGRMDFDPTSSTQPRQFVETFYPRATRKLRRSLVASISTATSLNEYLQYPKTLALTRATSRIKNELRPYLLSRKTFERIAKQSRDVRGKFIFESISNTIVAGNTIGLFEFEISWAKGLCQRFLFSRLQEYSATFTRPWDHASDNNASGVDSSSSSTDSPHVLVSGAWHLPSSIAAMAGIVDGYDEQLDGMNVQSLANFFCTTTASRDNTPQILFCVPDGSDVSQKAIIAQELQRAATTRTSTVAVRPPKMHFCNVDS